MDVKYILNEARYYKKLGGLSRAIKKFLFSQTPLRRIVNVPIYNRLYYQIIKKKAKKLEPSILQIENTNLCNARCIMCPHIIMKRKLKTMDFKDFKKILENIMKSYRIKRLTITGFGEPLIDPGITKKIEYLNKTYSDLKIDIYTNASLLSKELTDKLLKLKIDRMTFSVNGAYNNYKKIMGLNYKDTKNNLLYFLKENKKLKKPVLTNISLMILKDNEREIKKFIDFWAPLADSVRAYAPSNWAKSLKGISFVTKSPFRSKRWLCYTLWNNITVDVDGNVIMCCRDYESKEKFGNLLKQDIIEIRKSKKFQELLRKQANFNFSTPVCNKCDNSFDSSLDWWG